MYNTKKHRLIAYYNIVIIAPCIEFNCYTGKQLAHLKLEYYLLQVFLAVEIFLYCSVQKCNIWHQPIFLRRWFVILPYINALKYKPRGFLDRFARRMHHARFKVAGPP